MGLELETQGVGGECAFGEEAVDDGCQEPRAPLDVVRRHRGFAGEDGELSLDAMQAQSFERAVGGNFVIHPVRGDVRVVHRAPTLMRPIFGTELREHLSQALDEAFRGARAVSRMGSSGM